MADMVRAARAAGAADIARIHNQGIDERMATFETKERTAEGMAEVLAERDGRYPTVLVERDGRVVAWAGASEYRPRECYAGIAEFSVYVDRDARGSGVGAAAMRGLIASLGFREVGVYERHARLDGEWKDVVIVEKRIGVAT